MNEIFKNKLLNLGFKPIGKNLFLLTIPHALNATSSTWGVFAYSENNIPYFSITSELVEMFDAPDVNFDYILIKIKEKISNFNCFLLNNTKIAKEINIKNIEKELKDFISAVYAVDKLYENL